MSLPTITTDAAFCVVHESTTGEPDDVEKVGLEVNVRMVTWPTFTVTLAWIWPAELEAVRV